MRIQNGRCNDESKGDVMDRDDWVFVACAVASITLVILIKLEIIT